MTAETAKTEELVPPAVDAGQAPTPSFDEQTVAGMQPFVGTADIPTGVDLSIPRPGTSPLRDRLAAANAAARAASLERLATWFPGYDFEEAAQNVDGRRFAVLALGDALLDHLGGEEPLTRLLFEREWAWGMSGISYTHGDVKGHVSPPPFAALRPARHSDRGFLDPGGTARALEERWTTIINSADRSYAPLAEVCLDAARVYAASVNTNIYISWGPAKGFGAHWDTHDTIIVPVAGAKRWALFEPSVLSAQRPWVEPNVSDRPLWEGVLEPGMGLVIPRGWGHRVDGSDDLSIHHTIGINRLEVHSLLERVAFEAGYWPMFRADVPYDVGKPAISYGGSVFDEPDSFTRAVAEVASPELIDRAVATHRARLTRPVFPAFRPMFRAVAQGDWTDLAVRLNVPAGAMVHLESEDATIVAFNGRAVRISAEARDAFVALCDCELWEISKLPAVDTPAGDGRVEFARELVASGLAVVEPTSG